MSGLTEQHVKHGGRHFIVKSDEDGPRIIYERKVHAPGTNFESVHNASIWHRNNHKRTPKIDEILGLLP